MSGIIDAHVHLYPREVDLDPAGWAVRQGEPHWGILCTRRRRDGRPVQSLPTIDGLLAAMDAAGVARAVLLGWYWENPATCAWQNGYYAECVRAHPDRLAAFATFHPAAGRAQTLEQLAQAREAGLIGLGELSPHSQAYLIDHPVFQEVLDIAGEWKWPVNLHVTDPQSRHYPGRIDTPADDFVQLARAFPKTTFVLAHWGGMFPLTDARFPDLGNVYYDTAASPLLYDNGVWPRALGAMAPERVLFGSDFPLNLYPRTSVEAEMAQFVTEARAGGASEAVLGGNAARLLRL